MATDYDAPRRTETDDVSEDSLEELKARRNEAQSAVVDVDESESAENFELPGADLSGEELSVRVIPKQADEFTCSSCFLVHHRSRLASEKNGVMICTRLRGLTAGSAAQRRQHPVRVTAAHQPVRRRVVGIVEHHQDHRADPRPGARRRRPDRAGVPARPTWPIAAPRPTGRSR